MLSPPRDDGGAVAIVVAIVSLVLFGAGALVVDLGEVYARRRAAQTGADLAALAGVTELPDRTAARARAYDYLAKNLPAGGPMPPLTAFSDGDLTNGEVTFPDTYTIRVVAPPRTVQFGLAGALGFDETTVSAAATAAARSPAAAVPFFLTAAGASGYSCLKDTSPGGASGSAVRAALLRPAGPPPVVTGTSPTPLSTLGGELLTVDGRNLGGATSVRVDGAEVASWVVVRPTRIELTTPAHAAGPATLTVTTPDGTASAAVVYATPAAPRPVVTSLAPASGPETGGTEVTVTGTGLTNATAVTFGTTPATFTVTNATTIVATSPPGTAAVHVTVTTPGGTSEATDADLFTYEADACAGVNGSFGYLDVPRSTAPLPPGGGGPGSGGAANDLVVINAAAGIDHAWSAFPAAQLPAPGVECRSGVTTIPGAVLDDGGGVDGANCVEIENGNKTADVAAAFLDGYTRPGVTLPPRLAAPDGHDEVTIHGRGGLDGDTMSEYLNVSLETFVAALASGTVTPGMVKAEVVGCPRFAIVPVMNVTENPRNGFYPVRGFAGVFIDGPAPDRGFDANNNGSQVESIRAYAFSLDFLPAVVSGGTAEGTVTYLGTGPKVPVLVHDSADPAY